MNQPASREYLPEGYSLHWYTIKSVLGRGGSGVTYLAYDNNLDNQVAIKEYFPVDYSSRDEGSSVRATESPEHDFYYWGLDRFIKEARTLAKFKHHNIVRVLSVFEKNNTAYMVMDYELGKPLSKIYKEQQNLSQDYLVKIFIPILDGLNLVHKAGFIHRDIKPSNIYIRSDGSPVLIDFGAARRVMNSAATQQLTSIVTYGYAPFEQYNEGDEKQGPWTDIYALGACLYVAVTGSPPVEAMSRGSSMLSKGIDPYRPVSMQSSAHYSMGFLRSIDRALMFYAEDRPQDTSDWRDMLLGYLEAPALPEDMLRTVVGDVATAVMPYPPNRRRLNSGTYPSARNTIKPANVPEKKSKNKLLIPILVVLGLVAGVAALWLSGIFEAPDQPSSSVQTESNATRQMETMAPPLSGGQTTHRPETDSPERVRAKEINALLSQVDRAVEMGRLFEPVKQSAVFFLQRILDIDPSNAIASEKIQAIIEQSIDIAERHLKKGEITDAERTLNQLKLVTGETETVRQLEKAVQRSYEPKRMIPDLLARADAAFEQQRLTRPEDDNALTLYREVLAIERQNEAAQQGIEQIADYFEHEVRLHIQRGNITRAKQSLNTLEFIDPNFPSLTELQDIIAREVAINSLLEKARQAMNRGRLTIPEGGNATYYFNKALSLSPGNSQAKQGIQHIKDRLRQKFKSYLEANDLRLAESVVKKVEAIFPDSRIAISLRDRFEKESLPSRSDIEMISETLMRFKSAFETRSIDDLRKVSKLTADKLTFLNQFFEQYQSFKVEITNFQHIANDGKGVVDVKLTNLIDQVGQKVSGGYWSHLSVEVRRNTTGQWQVYW